MQAVAIDGRMHSVPQSRIEALLMMGYGGGTGTGVTDYNLLSNKPKINGVELVGDKSWGDLGLELDEITSEDLSDMWGD